MEVGLESGQVGVVSVLRSGGMMREVSRGFFDESIGVEEEVVLDLCVDGDVVSKQVVSSLISKIKESLLDLK
jgi:hypothetical protein